MKRPRILFATVALLMAATALSHCDKKEPASESLPSVEPKAAPAAVPEDSGANANAATPVADATPAGKSEVKAPVGTAAAADAGASAKPAASDAGPAAAATAKVDAKVDAATPTPGTAAAVVGPPAARGTKPISDASGDSYEATLVRAIIAAMNPDEEKGWALYQKELHSDELFAQRLKAIRRFNWPYFRRKVPLYLADDKKPEIRIVRVEQLPKDQVKVFVFNEKSMPTPCHLKKDPEAKGAYRITNCSL